jgi:hypothetical protein
MTVGVVAAAVAVWWFGNRRVERDASEVGEVIFSNRPLA